MSKSTEGYDKPLISDEERDKVERFMEGLGFHLEQNHKTPATLRKDELWMSNDTEDQVFYPHNIHQDLAAHLYQAFDQELGKQLQEAEKFNYELGYRTAKSEQGVGNGNNTPA